MFRNKRDENREDIILFGIVRILVTIGEHLKYESQRIAQLVGRLCRDIFVNVMLKAVDY